MIAALALSACLPPQTLSSPCVGQPVSVDGDACPACTTDADCFIASNRCYDSAACVPREGHWGVTLLGCNVEHPPPVAQCGCVSGVCAAK